jgi:hypothetical protein
LYYRILIICNKCCPFLLLKQWLCYFSVFKNIFLL